MSLNSNTLRDGIARFFISANIPIRLVENEGFISLVRLLNPNDTSLPVKRSAFTKHISTMFIEDRAKIMDQLKVANSKISLTSDVWTSPNYQAFMSVTAHFIDTDWNLRDIMLDLIYLGDDKHSGSILASKLLERLQTFGIAEKILALTCDDASNMLKLGEELEKLLPTFNNSQYVLDASTT